MMHYILLGFLPFSRMRERSDPSLAAGCGQLFLTTRDAYDRAGHTKQSRRRDMMDSNYRVSTARRV